MWVVDSSQRADAEADAAKAAAAHSRVLVLEQAAG
jgi:hypothetical protein